MDTTTTSTGMNTRHPTGNGGSEEIKAHIEETRAHMDDTLDALSERLRPRHLLDDLLDFWHARRERRRVEGGHSGDGQARRKMKKAASQVKHSAGDAGRTIIHQVQAHPVPALLIGAGIAWLLMEDKEEGYEVEDLYAEDYYSSEDEFGYENQIRPGPGPETYALPAHYSEEESKGGKMSRLKEKGSNMAARAGEGWERMKRRTSRGTEELRHRARERGTVMKEQARRRYDQGVQRFKQTSDDYPLAVGAGFLALGLVAGMLLPSTRREDQWVGPTRDRLVNRSREAAHDAMERGKHVAQAATQAAKSELREQGLTPEELKAKGKHVWESAKETARQEGMTPEAIKEKAKTAATHVKDTTTQEARREAEGMKHQV